jgi:Mg/Co/Ni transporter MgtE
LQRADILSLLDNATRLEVGSLSAYKEDVAGGVMNPLFARLQPDMKVGVAMEPGRSADFL